MTLSSIHYYGGERTRDWISNFPDPCWTLNPLGHAPASIFVAATVVVVAAVAVAVIVIVVAAAVLAFDVPTTAS